MIKFAYSLYELKPKADIGALASAKPRRGALLRVSWPDNKVGYADLFPWPEMGDADVDTHLEALGKGRISYLVEQSIWLARKDAVFRAVAKNAFKDKPKVKNHFLVTDYKTLDDHKIDDLKNKGFTTLKFKVGKDIEEDARYITRFITRYSKNFRVRLDFNTRLNFAEFERFMSYFDANSVKAVEFIEEPFVYHLESWKEAAKLAPLAIDFEYDKVDWFKFTEPPFKFVVIKPGRQDVELAIERAMKFKLGVVVTSSLDHAVGVAHAACVAAEVKSHPMVNLLECGCLSLESYEPDSFTQELQVTGPYIQGNSGTGVGFDRLLQEIQWVNLQP